MSGSEGAATGESWIGRNGWLLAATWLVFLVFPWLAIVSDEGALAAAVDNAIAANPDVADKIRDGKVAAAGALIGAVMKEMRGQADANRVRELILERLT